MVKFSRKRSSRARGKTRKTTVRPRSPIVTRSVSRRKKTQKPRMKSLVYITGPANSGHTHRVAQLIAENSNGKNVAVRLNYNGQLLILKKSEIRVATAAEKKLDPKLHRRETFLTMDERNRLIAS